MKKIIKFGAPWCGPCKIQDKILDQLQGVEIEKVNVDENEQLAEQYNITNVPAIVVLEDGEEIQRFIGLTQLKTLQELL